MSEGVLVQILAIYGVRSQNTRRPPGYLPIRACVPTNLVAKGKDVEDEGSLGRVLDKDGVYALTIAFLCLQIVMKYSYETTCNRQ